MPDPASHGSHILGATCSRLSSYLCFAFTPIIQAFHTPSTSHDVYQVLLHAGQLKMKARKQKGVKFDFLLSLEIKHHIFS